MKYTPQQITAKAEQFSNNVQVQTGIVIGWTDNPNTYTQEEAIAFANFCILEGILPGKITESDIKRFYPSLNQ